jgi:hypothetical protein
VTGEPPSSSEELMKSTVIWLTVVNWLTTVGGGCGFSGTLAKVNRVDWLIVEPITLWHSTFTLRDLPVKPLRVTSYSNRSSRTLT